MWEEKDPSVIPMNYYFMELILFYYQYNASSVLFLVPIGWVQPSKDLRETMVTKSHCSSALSNLIMEIPP